MNIVKIPPINEIKFAPEGITLTARYHQKEFNQGWMYELLQPFQLKREYKIRKQNNDRNCIQIHASTAVTADVNLKIYNKNLTLIGTEAPSQAITVSGNVVDGVQLTTYQFDFLTSKYIGVEGTFHYVLEVDFGSVIKMFISEPIKVKSDWEDTILIEASHNKNEFDIYFALNTRFSYRVDGYWIEDSITEEDTQFTDQDNVTKTLSTDSTTILRIELKKLPFYLYKILTEAFKCKSVSVERWRITKASGATWDINKSDGSSMVLGSIKLNYYAPKETFTFKSGNVLDLFTISATPNLIANLTITDPNFGNVIVFNEEIIEDAADAATKVAGRNALALSLGMEGTFAINGGVFQYVNGPGENFTVLFSQIYLNVLNLNLNLPVAAANYTFTYRAVNDFYVEWETGSIDQCLAGTSVNLTKSHTYANGGATTETARIFHNNELTQLDSSDPTTTAKILSITGVCSNILLKHTVANNVDSSVTNWDLSYLSPTVLTLERLAIFNSTIETLNNNPFNPLIPKVVNFHNLKFISLVNNKLTLAAVDNFIIDFESICNYSYNGASTGIMFLQGQTPGIVPTPANYAPLVAAGWAIQV
jgi:hypothetical protein